LATALFLLDTGFDALMLALAVRLGGGRIRPYRVLAGALTGAALAALARRLALGRGQALLLWLPAALTMTAIAWGSMRQCIRHALLLFCAAGLLGGMVLSLWGATGSLWAAYALGGAAAAAAGWCAVRAGHAVQDVQTARMICAYRGHRAVFEAMIDSGNTLRDYLTHRPVIVIAEHAGRKALHIEDTPLRPIFAQTAGGRQRMSVFSPQEIVLEADGMLWRVQAVIALSPQLPADTPALVPASLLGGHTGENID